MTGAQRFGQKRGRLVAPHWLAIICLRCLRRSSSRSRWAMGTCAPRRRSRNVSVNRSSNAIAPRSPRACERREWAEVRRLYEGMSRLSQVPLVGAPLRQAIEAITAIPHLHPYRDLSPPTLGTRVLHHFIDAGIGTRARGEDERGRSSAARYLLRAGDRCRAPRRQRHRVRLSGHRCRHQSRVGATVETNRLAVFATSSRRFARNGAS